MGNQDEKIAALDRQKQALALRLAGIPYEQIAEQLGYKGRGGAFAAVKSALKFTLREPADELRSVEVRRLDAALAAIWVQVKQGNLSAVDRFVKLADRRARLLGLDAPTKTDITSAGEKIGTDVDIRSEILRKLDSIAAVASAGSVRVQPDIDPAPSTEV